jgi:hypothetical protein
MWVGALRLEINFHLTMHAASQEFCSSNMIFHMLHSWKAFARLQTSSLLCKFDLVSSSFFTREHRFQGDTGREGRGW